MTSFREIPLARPDVSQADIEAVLAVLKTPHLSLGPAIPRFEAAFCTRLSCKHAVAVNSGTAALHLAVRAYGIGPGDEVITSPFTFIATSNCALFEGATPVFVDIDPDTWNIDPQKAAAAVTTRTKAIIPVDVFGQPADMDAICAIARRHNIKVIEDSAEALGATYKGRPAGMLGDVGVFAFYPNKQITTGEGGVLITNDDEVARLARSMRNQGRDPSSGWLGHPRLGYNYRMPDILAALGTSQLGRLDEFVAKRAKVAGMYSQRLREERRVGLQKIEPHVSMSWFVFVVKLADSYEAKDRDRIMAELRKRNIGCNNYFAPIHLQPFYAEKFGYKRGDFPITERVADRTFALPFHPNLSEAEVDEVVRVLRSLL
jgi:perosamine synthetase